MINTTPIVEEIITNGDTLRADDTALNADFNASVSKVAVVSVERGVSSVIIKINE